MNSRERLKLTLEHKKPSLIQRKMSLKARVMLLIFYQIIYLFPTVLF